MKKVKFEKPPIFPEWGKIRTINGNRYRIGGNKVAADFNDGQNLPHYNHIEMSGFKTSVIASYEIGEERKLRLYKWCAFPEYRINPNSTNGHLSCIAQGVEIICAEPFYTDKVVFDGVLSLLGRAGNLAIGHSITAARNKAAEIEEYVIVNKGGDDAEIIVRNVMPTHIINGKYTASGEDYHIHTAVYINGAENSKIILKRGEKASVLVSCGVDKLTANEIKEQFKERRAFIDTLRNLTVITTPDPTINLLIQMCKIRACESIYDTKSSLMHSPGGGSYYAALWTNDQCEYVNPLFAYLGYDKGEEQSLNCYRLYGGLVKRNRAVFTSIIAGGDGYWHGAKDRGDTSMYLYGLARYLLTSGDKKTAEEFLEIIERGIHYIKSRISGKGVVRSDSDELENRFPSGKYNLCTQVLTMDAVLSLSYLFKDMQLGGRADEMTEIYGKLSVGLKKFFERNVEGYDTYRYCDKENTHLRSWICMPLTIGVNDRGDATAAALTSDKLHSCNGILTKSGDTVYWDRSALYALRGIFYTGHTDKAIDMLTSYSKLRLLGEHVPYPIEAFPEGNMAHLSAESGLYIRIFTEGMLGYRPTGFDRFTIKPNLPNEWDCVTIDNIKLCGKTTDLHVRKNGGEYIIKVFGKEYRARPNHEVEITAR